MHFFDQLSVQFKWFTQKIYEQALDIAKDEAWSNIVSFARIHNSQSSNFLWLQVVSADVTWVLEGAA